MLFLLRRQLLFATFDPEVASAYGVATGRIDLLFVILLAVTVLAATQILGVTLVAAAMVIPPVIARYLTQKFQTLLIVSPRDRRILRRRRHVFEFLLRHLFGRDHRADRRGDLYAVGISLDCAQRESHRHALPLTKTTRNSLIVSQTVYKIGLIGLLLKPMALRPRPLITRSASALWAASFLFFLLYSTPHQVHHFFEQFPQAHHHDGDHEHTDSNHSNHASNDSNCAFQVSASRCHLGLAWQVTPASLPVLVRPPTLSQAANNGANLLPLPFQSRAPPPA